jgi:hypothetical protein
MPERPGGAPFVNALPASVIERYEREHPEQHTGSVDESATLYHGSNADPEHVERHGLQPMPGLSDAGMLGEGVTHAVFMTPDPDEAAGYGSHVYRVDGRGLDLEKVDGPDGYHYVSLSPIEPSRVRPDER